MLWAMAVIFLASWGLGVASGAVLGAWVHWLLAAGLIALTFAVLQATRVRPMAAPARAQPPRSQQP